jgi:hypothetical protein
MYVLVLAFSFSIFVIYKNQMNANMLLPELGPASEQVYNLVNVIFLLTLFSKLIAVVMRIFE